MAVARRFAMVARWLPDGCFAEKMSHKVIFVCANGCMEVARWLYDDYRTGVALRHVSQSDFCLCERLHGGCTMVIGRVGALRKCQ